MHRRHFFLYLLSFLKIFLRVTNSSLSFRNYAGQIVYQQNVKHINLVEHLRYIQCTDVIQSKWNRGINDNDTF